MQSAAGGITNFCMPSRRYMLTTNVGQDWPSGAGQPSLSSGAPSSSKLDVKTLREVVTLTFVDLCGNLRRKPRKFETAYPEKFICSENTNSKDRLTQSHCFKHRQAGARMGV